LQDGDQRELRWRDGRLAEPALTVDPALLLLKALVEDLVASVAQENEELLPLHTPRHRLFGW
jgi:hypothetical protein